MATKAERARAEAQIANSEKHRKGEPPPPPKSRKRPERPALAAEHKPAKGGGSRTRKMRGSTPEARATRGK